MFARLSFWIALTVLCSIGFQNTSTAEPPDFVNDVFPILQKNCVACHNLQKSEGGLNLESMEMLKKGGESGALFEQGKSTDSSLIRRVKGEEDIMPPEGNNVGAKQLTQEEINILKQWIEGGAIVGVKKASKSMQWQPLPDSVRPIYAVDTTSDGQFTALGRGNQAIVYRWAADGASDKKLLADPSVLLGDGSQAVSNATHLDIVQSIAVSSDGLRVATGGYRDVKIWKRSAGPINDALSASLRGSTHISSSPNGQWLAKGTRDPSLDILSSDSGKLAFRLDLSSPVAAIGWNADSTKLLVATAERHVHAYELDASKAAGKSISPAQTQQLDVGLREILWLADGGMITKGDDAKVHVWGWKAASGDQPAQWEKKEILKEHSNVQSISRVNDTLVAVGIADGNIHLVNYPAGSSIKSVVHGGPLAKLLSTMDGKKLISVGKDGITKAWNPADGKMVWENQLDSLRSAKINSSEVRFARQKAKVDRATAKKPELEKNKTAENDNLAKLQKTRGEVGESLKKKEAEVETQTKQVGEAETAMKAAEQALEEAKKKLEQSQKDVETKKQQLANAEKAKTDEMTKLVTIDKTIAAANASIEKAAAALVDFQKQLESDQSSLKTLEQENQKVKESTKPVPANDAIVSIDGRSIITSRADGSLHIIQAERGLNQSTDSGSLDSPLGLAVTNQGRVLSAHEDGRSASWAISNEWTLERTIGNVTESPFSDRITALEFSENGELLVVGSGPPSRFGELKLLSVLDGSIQKDWGQVHSDSILVAKFSPDGKTVATGGADKQVRLHAIADGTPTRTLEGHTHHVLGLAWHDDGFLLASSSADNTVKIWDLELGQSQRTITGFGKEVTALSFVGRSNQLLSSSADQQTRLHDATNGRLIRSYGGPADALYSLASASASPNTSLAIAGGQDGVLWVWQVEDGKAIAQIK
jgi:WD40 repeat protein